MDEEVIAITPVEPKTWLRQLYKRLISMARELGHEQVGIQLHCLKCNKVIKVVRVDPVVLRCQCRERTVRV